MRLTAVRPLIALIAFFPLTVAYRAVLAPSHVLTLNKPQSTSWQWNAAPDPNIASSPVTHPSLSDVQALATRSSAASAPPLPTAPRHTYANKEGFIVAGNDALPPKHDITLTEAETICNGLPTCKAITFFSDKPAPNGTISLVYFKNVTMLTFSTTWQTWLKDYHPPPPPPPPGGGSLWLPTIFADNMVLQRAPHNAKVWGYGAPGEAVSLAIFAPQRVLQLTATAAADGAWSLVLPPQQPISSVSVEVSAPSGNITLKNVAFGDVFLCSGQSNMAFAVSQAFNKSAIYADAVKHPDLRLFTVKQAAPPLPVLDVNVSTPYTGWGISNSSTLSGPAFGWFSAVCYLYGRDVHTALGKSVPTGLVASDVGGTMIEQWSSADATTMCAAPAAHLEDSSPLQAPRAGPHPWQGDVKVTPGGGLWNGMIAPLLNFTVLGVVWYQGEANLGAPILYGCQHRALITDWRNKFGLPHMHWTFVELAPGPGAQNKKARTFLTSYLRQSQLEALALPNVSYASAVDLGDPFSPFGWWHPRAKQPLAARLAATTLRDIYSRPVPASGPNVTSATKTADGSGYVLTFDNAEGLHLRPTPNCSHVAQLLTGSYSPAFGAALQAACPQFTYKGPPCPLCCNTTEAATFELLTAQGEWVAVSPSIDGARVTVTLPRSAGSGGRGPRVQTIVGLQSEDPARRMLRDAHAGGVIGVRYAWSDYPLCAVRNKRGIVASPFQLAGCSFDNSTKFTLWPSLDNVKGKVTPAKSSGAFVYVGNFTSALACANAAVAASTPGNTLLSFTWYSTNYTGIPTPGPPSPLAGLCYGRTDDTWGPVNMCRNGDPGCAGYDVASGQLCA